MSYGERPKYSSQNRPYKKACNQCGQLITMGLDEDSRWRPWDEYDSKKHNCAKRDQQQQSSGRNGNTGAAAGAIQETLEGLFESNKRIEDSQSTLSWKTDGLTDIVKQIAKHLNIEIPEATRED